MPVPAIIEAAAQNFRYNNGFLAESLKDLTDEEWQRRPNDCTNHIGWIVGHLVWARTMLFKRLGAEWSKPWAGEFARGAKVEAASCPSPSEMLAAWNESCTVLQSAMESASEELLSQPVVKGPPTADGKLSGAVNFLAIHETYHVGQAAYLRCWLGKKGPMG